MNEHEIYQLSDIQLIYLFQKRQDGVLFGISDPFQFAGDSERASSLASAELELIDRGLLKPSFGGKTTVESNLMRSLEVCAGFEYYIGYDLKEPGAELITERFYYRDGQWVSICDENDLLTIKEVDRPAELLYRLPNSTNEGNTDFDVSITRRDLNEVVRLFQSGQQNDAHKILSDRNWPNDCQDALLGALAGTQEWVSLTLASRPGDDIHTENVAVIEKDGKIYEFYQAVDEDDRTVIGLKPASNGEYLRLKEVAERWSAT